MDIMKGECDSESHGECKCSTAKEIMMSLKVANTFNRIGGVVNRSYKVTLLAVLAGIALLAAPVSGFGHERHYSWTWLMDFRLMVSILLPSVLALLTILTANAVLTFGFSAGSSSTKKSDIHKYSEDEKKQLTKLMSGALKLETISYDPSGLGTHKTDYGELLKMHAYLEKQFPLIHSANTQVSRTVVNKYSLLYEWRGIDETLEPIMLCAHLDVVPAPEETLEHWKHSPFSGHIDDDNVVWGRGAIDNKHNLLMQMLAVEKMLAKGISAPARTVFLAYGHDEEIGGADGAKEIAKEVTKRLGDKRLSFIFDEGTFVIKNLIPGLDKPLGLISNSEKGNISVKLSVSANDPGHSSMPPRETNLGILSKAIQKIEKKPFPAHMDAFVESMREIGPDLPLWLKIMLANTWLFKPLMEYAISLSNVMAASIRTTTALTVARYGEKINIVNAEANAWINHRIHPGDIDGDQVLAYDQHVVSDFRVKVEKYLEGTGFGYIPPSPTSSVEAPQYEFVSSIVERTTGCIAIPNLMMGNTDTRWYWSLSKNIYRHSPIVFENLKDTKMFHGLNERISGDQLATLLHFYSRLIENLSELS